MIKDKAQLDEYFDLIKKSISLDMDDVAKILIRSYADKGWISNACSVPHAVDSCRADRADDQCKSGEQAPGIPLFKTSDPEYAQWLFENQFAFRTIYDLKECATEFGQPSELKNAINQLLGVKSYG